MFERKEGRSSKHLLEAEVLLMEEVVAVLEEVLKKYYSRFGLWTVFVTPVEELVVFFRLVEGEPLKVLQK